MLTIGEILIALLLYGIGVYFFVLLVSPKAYVTMLGRLTPPVFLKYVHTAPGRFQMRVFGGICFAAAFLFLVVFLRR